MTSDKALAVLEGTRALLSNPNHWTKGENARDAMGHATGDSAPTAVCWCLLGALSHVSLKVAPEDDECRHYDEAKHAVCTFLPDSNKFRYPNIVDWNDDAERTHADVLKLLDLAIIEAKGNV